MKIIFSKNDLIKAINISLRAIPVRSTMPILEFLYIDANQDTIKFISNDMEIGIETIVKGDVIEKGTIAINAKLFSEIIKKLPDSEIILDSKESSSINISSDSAFFTIPACSGEEFVFLPLVEKEKKISVSQFTLKEVIRQTIFSISTSDNNKIMTGELFEVNNNELRIASLDGHRISLRKIILKENYDNIKVIVPGKTLNEISKILNDDNESEVNIYFAKNHIVFEFENTYVVSRLIEGEYYNINQMISSTHKIKARVNKKDIYSCIDRSTLLVREGDKKPIIIDITDGQLELMIKSNIGSMDEKISIEKEGEDIKIGFNPRFLIDALRVIDDEFIDIYMVNPKFPCIIKDEKESYIYLILPVNFNVG